MQEVNLKDALLKNYDDVYSFGIILKDYLVDVSSFTDYMKLLNEISIYRENRKRFSQLSLYWLCSASDDTSLDDGLINKVLGSNLIKSECIYSILEGIFNKENGYANFVKFMLSCDLFLRKKLSLFSLLWWLFIDETVDFVYKLASVEIHNRAGGCKEDH